jgi:hypothetical protein
MLNSNWYTKINRIDACWQKIVSDRIEVRSEFKGSKLKGSRSDQSLKVKHYLNLIKRLKR